MAVLVALTFGSLGYYLGSQSSFCKEPLSGKSDTYDRIPSDTAYKWIRNYGQFAGALASDMVRVDTTIRNLGIEYAVPGAGWTIPMDDIIDVLDTCKSHCTSGRKYVRAYLGVEGYPKQFNVHLVLAIVNDFGKGCCGAGTDAVQSYYFDLVRPCPNMCDIYSPLYKHYLEGVRDSVPNYGIICNDNGDSCFPKLGQTP
ncbi:MAG: hypothetical protein QM534_04320 [Sediminibacterium sp.]|nr:hypothetical protein [Sediminibacterium sp.]